jgi:signal transduction histidine kinase
MFTREELRYGKLWVRVLCCMAVAIAVGNAVFFQILTPIENLFKELVMLGEGGDKYMYVSQITEIAVASCMCLLPSIPRIERPIMMILWGIGLMLAYLLVVLGFLLTLDLVLPVASPVVSLIGATLMLETMAWSEEHAIRRKLERLEEIRQQLADMLVHDLKKRMSSILTSFSMLQKEMSSRQMDSPEHMATIKTSADRMLILISNLLDIRKFDEGAMSLHCEVVRLRNMLEESLEEHRPAAELADIRMSLCGSDDVKVRVDRQIFWRILSNLIWNALQHAPQDSEVEVGYGLVQSGAASVYVANRGRPIPLREKDELFRPFASSQRNWRARPPDSTGLGLAFCKLAVEAHGGTIEIESPWEKHNDGVKIVVSLPL